MFADQSHGPHFSISIECILDILLPHALLQPPTVEGGDHLILWGLQVRHSLGSLEELLCHRVIDSLVTILDVLDREGVIRVGRFVMSEGHSSPLLHSPFTQKEQMWGLFLL